MSLTKFLEQEPNPHFVLSPDHFAIPTPVGPHIRLNNDGTVTILAGAGQFTAQEKARIRETVGPENNLPMMELNVDQGALENWAEQLINQAYESRAITLVLSLGLFTEKDGFLKTSEIVARVNAATQMELPVTDKDGVTITVLDLFDGNREACIATLIQGLFKLVLAALRKNDQKPDMACTCFDRAAHSLGVTGEHYETAILVVEKSHLLHQWLYPNGDVQSLYHSVLAVLDNAAARQALLPQLHALVNNLTDPKIQAAAYEEGFLPAGDIIMYTDHDQPLIESTSAAVIETLANDPVVAIQLIMFMMSEGSQQHLNAYLQERLGVTPPEVYRQQLPIIEVDDEFEDEDGQ